MNSSKSCRIPSDTKGSSEQQKQNVRHRRNLLFLHINLHIFGVCTFTKLVNPSDLATNVRSTAPILPSVAKSLTLSRLKIDRNENAQWQSIGARELTYRNCKRDLRGTLLALNHVIVPFTKLQAYELCVAYIKQ